MSEFEKRAEERRENIATTVWRYVVARRKYWLLPAIAALVLLALFGVIAASGAGPLVYALF